VIRVPVFGYTELFACRADAITIIGQASQQIGLQLLKVRRLELGLATGNNAARIDAEVFDEIFAALGSGKDQFVIRSSAISRTCSVAAGLGFDVLVSEGNLFAQAHFQGFEAPTGIQIRMLRRVA
jgi:hypothetical protein